MATRHHFPTGIKLSFHFLDDDFTDTGSMQSLGYIAHASFVAAISLSVKSYAYPVALNVTAKTPEKARTRIIFFI